MDKILEEEFNEVWKNKNQSKEIKDFSMRINGYLKDGKYTEKIPYMCRPQVIQTVKCNGSCMSCILLNICENDGMES